MPDHRRATTGAGPGPAREPRGAAPVGCRSEIEARLAGLRGELAALGVAALHLFGSAARDELLGGSDVDVLVDLDRPATLDSFMALKELLEARLGRRVDLVTRGSLRPRLAARIAGELRRVA